MPTGQSRKKVRREVPAAAPPEVPATLSQLNQAQMAVVQYQLGRVGSDIRERLIEEAPDIVATLLALAKGIKVLTIGTNGKELVYSVPPYFPAVKYLTEWARLILETDPAPSHNRHGLDKETRELLERYIGARGDRPPLPDVKDGAYVLGTSRVIEETDDSAAADIRADEDGTYAPALD